MQAAATLDALSLSDRACAQKVLSGAPFTDASLPTKGGNVPPSEVPFIPGLYYPKSLFAANYERPLPAIGNALRKNMDAAGRELQFAKPKATMDDDVFVKRAKTEAALSMDYLDLLNKVVDAVQQLESDLMMRGLTAKPLLRILTRPGAARSGWRRRGPPAAKVGALCASGSSDFLWFYLLCLQSVAEYVHKTSYDVATEGNGESRTPEPPSAARAAAARTRRGPRRRPRSSPRTRRGRTAPRSAP